MEGLQIPLNLKENVLLIPVVNSNFSNSVLIFIAVILTPLPTYF